MQIHPLAISAVISLVFSALTLPNWIRRSQEHGFLITDVQKLPNRKIPYLAGLTVVLSIVVGIFSYVAQEVFLNNNNSQTFVLLAAASAILISLIIGIVDDLLGEKIGLSQISKPLLMLLAALPLSVINAGKKIMSFPFAGRVELGSTYPFAVIPLAIAGASNGFNMLAGLNGLEAGMGLIILSALGYYSLAMQEYAAAAVAYCAVFAVIPFFYYNMYPARILPGNGFTYSIGAAIAIVAILADAERTALLLFTPYFIELFLKARGRFKKESLAVPLADGSIKNQYAKWYSLNHIAISALRKIKGRAYEWEACAVILGLELLIVSAVFWRHF